MRIRTGRRNPRALWLQVGVVPDDEVDVFVGSTTTREAATAVVGLAEVGALAAPDAAALVLRDAYEADSR